MKYIVCYSGGHSSALEAERYQMEKEKEDKT